MQLTNDAAWAAYPAWSPDGSTLAYVLVTRGRGNDHLKVVTIPDDLRGQPGSCN
jgi:Tol biopolymer transport system component